MNEPHPADVPTVGRLAARVAELEAALRAIWGDVAGDVGGEPHLIGPGPLYRVRAALFGPAGPFDVILEPVPREAETP